MDKQRLKLTGAAIMVSLVTPSLKAALATYP
jgi:hypothetical protein